jgi:hypothetical protein
MLLAVLRKVTAFVTNTACLSFSGTKVLQCLALRVLWNMGAIQGIKNGESF